jgi:CRISPR system Cascade subunit CasB
MPDTARIPPKADDMVRAVTRLARKNPADRSALRHSLGKRPEEAALAVHRIVVPFLPGPPDSDRKASGYAAAERAYYAVAALIASQPRGARDQLASDDPAEIPDRNGVRQDTAGGRDQERRHWRNLGSSLAHAVSQGGNEKSLEGHLQLLTRQDIEGLYRHLPRLILQLRGDQVRIDWGVLTGDLIRWARDPRLVAKEWAQSYYRTSERLAAGKAKKQSSENTNKETAS